MSVPWDVKITRHEADLDDDGHDAIENLVTAETDTALVFAPDGVGGVEARAEAGGSSGGTGNVFTSQQQVLQSRHYLMRDGTWRDPFVAGLGTLTVGTPATVTDDSKYNAWPSLARAHDGRIVLLYTKADSHHSDNTGKAVVRLGTEYPDGTITWSAETTVYDDPSVWVSGQGVTVLSTGRVVVSMFAGNYSSNPLDGAYVSWSDDLVTWSAPVLVNSTLTSYSYGSGGVLECTNGDWLQCVEGKNSGDTFSRMVVLRSTDDGATWGSQVTIATGTRDYYEAAPGRLSDGSLLVLLRTSDASGDIYQSRSTDDGATWSTPALAFAGHGEPYWTQLSSGTLVACTRQNLGTGTGGVWVYTSTNLASTWSSATLVDGTPYEMEYASPLELYDGRILVAYGYQPSSAITNADINVVILTEGQTTTQAQATAAATAAQAAAEATAAAALAAHVAAGGTSGGVTDHVHVIAEAHTSDGSTTAFLLDNEFDEGSVSAWNLTSGLRLAVTETLPRTATIGAAGTAGNIIAFDYIPVTA